MMGDTFIDGYDRWNIPDDRQLALRGRLETGWSSYPGNTFSHNVGSYISEDEQELVLSVLQRKEEINIQEQYRIGMLVKKLEHMKKNILGDGLTTCLICGTKAGLLKDSLHYCGKCGKMVCSKCSIEVSPPHDYCGKYYLCVLCYEDKMLWKRSGAWFYNSLPKYIVPEKKAENDTRNMGHSDHIMRTSAMVPSMRHGTWADRTQDSADDYSDDSDIESQTAKAFDIPGNRQMNFHYINFDEDSHSIRSMERGSPEVHKKRSADSLKPTIAFSSADEADGEIKGNHYSRQASSNSFSDSKSSPELRAGESFDKISIASSDSNFRNSRLGMKGVWRRKSHEDSNGSGRNSPNLKVNGHEDKISLDASVSSGNSEQDIDAMFKSYEDKAGSTEFCGQFGMIKFTLQYDPDTQELLVIIASCKGLKTGEKGSILNPYVKSVILPISPEAAKASKKRTPTLKKESDPVFNFSIVYPGISDSDIQNKGIRLSVMNEASFGNDTIIGETCIDLKNLAHRPVQQFRRILDSRANDETLFLDSKNPVANPGRIELALHYLSKQQKLVVGIIRCVGLKALDPNGYSDPYVKCYLLPDPSKKTKRKTVIKKKTLNPEFNQEFQYEIAHSELAKKHLHVTVWDHDVATSNDFIGGLTLGIESTGDCLKHWFETLQKADCRVIRWHDLSENCPIVNE